MDRTKKQPTAFIHQSELDFISRCVMDYPEQETGGDFFGFWSRDGNPVIQYVIGPGKKTTRTEKSFFQEIDYLKECGAFLHSRFRLEHIGAWHSHHRMALHQPSSGDVHTMTNALRDSNLSRFVISIFNIDGKSSLSVGCFLFANDNLGEYVPCSCTILSGTSPVRQMIEESDSALFEMPKNESFQVIIRDNESPKSSIVKEKVEKPDFPDKSFWKTTEGENYLKKVFEKMKARDDVSDVEILQLADKRVAISFKYEDGIYEIRFPENFPKSTPEVIGKKTEEEHKARRTIKSFLIPSKNIKSLQKVIYSLGVVDEGKIVIIRYQ